MLQNTNATFDNEIQNTTAIWNQQSNIQRPIPKLSAIRFEGDYIDESTDNSNSKLWSNKIQQSTELRKPNQRPPKSSKQRELQPKFQMAKKSYDQFHKSSKPESQSLNKPIGFNPIESSTEKKGANIKKNSGATYDSTTYSTTLTRSPG